MSNQWKILGLVLLLVSPLWAQPREWSDAFTVARTYDSASLNAPCSGGPSTKYTLLEGLGGDIYNERAVSGGGALVFSNRWKTGLLGRLELMGIGVLDMGQDCPDNPDPTSGASQITSEPFTSDNLCVYGGVRWDHWQLRLLVNTGNIKGTDGQPGVANVDDDLNGVTDNDEESPAARPTTVGLGYGNANGTGFRAGVDAAPGAAGVDDDGNGVIDDSGETGWPGSDDGDDGIRQAYWVVMDADVNTSSTIQIEMDPPSTGDQFNLRHIVSGADAGLQSANEIVAHFYQPYTQYNWVFCSSGTCYGAMMWTRTDLANPAETLGPVVNTKHTTPGANLVGFGFYQNSQPLQYIRRQRTFGNTNFSDTYWVVSGNPAQFYPSPSPDLDNDKDVDGFDFLTFSNCYNGSNKPPLAACANTQADLDKDGDVDGFDFLTFSNCYNGSNRKPLSACFPPNLTACAS